MVFCLKKFVVCVSVGGGLIITIDDSSVMTLKVLRKVLFFKKILTKVTLKVAKTHLGLYYHFIIKIVNVLCSIRTVFQ